MPRISTVPTFRTQAAPSSAEPGTVREPGPDFAAIAAALRATGGAPVDTFDALLAAGVGWELAIPLAGFLDPATPTAAVLGPGPGADAMAEGTYYLEAQVPAGLRDTALQDLVEALQACYCTGSPAGSFLFREGGGGDRWLRFERDLWDDAPCLQDGGRYRRSIQEDLVAQLAAELDEGAGNLGILPVEDLQRLGPSAIEDLIRSLAQPLREGRAATLLSPLA